MRPPLPWRRDAAIVAAAAVELAAREKHYPAMVQRGDLTQAAATEDLAAWRVLAALVDRGVVEHSGETWNGLILALDRAVRSRSSALDEKPGDPYLASRLAGVERIREIIVRSAAHARAAA